MIVIKPDKKIKHRFKKSVDFDVLSSIYSLLYSTYAIKSANYVIILKATAGKWSFYSKQKHRKRVKINISDNVLSPTLFQTTLLHEFRHFLQDRVMHVPWTAEEYDDSTYKTYKKSPSEVDAMFFDKSLGRRMVRLHDKLRKMKVVWKKYEKYKRS
jgi:hypothetical protein